MRIDISSLAAAFPDFRVAVVVATGLSIPPVRPPDLAALIAEREAACCARWAGTELSAIPGIAVWRTAYRAFGIKKTSYRCSVERLVKNVLADRPLPAINAFVDAYNAVSLTHVMPAGADDLAHVVGDVAFRYARSGDTFLDMAPGEEGQGPVSDPPKTGEVVYADAEKVLCRRWNWRQDARSLVSSTTTRAIVTIQSNGAGNLDAALADLSDLIHHFCGGTIRATVADARSPSMEIS
jgi:DNA/RNA-binding domain of Phe-tRNA-synthetase-like protein